MLSTARADEHFLGSLRSAPRQTAEEYQRRRRAHLNLPQYKELTPEQQTKAKRLFASIDLDGSGSIDAEELRKFLVGIGHKSSDKHVKKLLEAADAHVRIPMVGFAESFNVSVSVALCLHELLPKLRASAAPISPGRC